MADGFVQQHARPAAAEHDRHDAGRRVDRFEIHQRLAQRFARPRLGLAVGEQFFVRVSPAATGVAAFATTVLLDDHLHVQAHQRAHVGGEHAIAARDQHGVDAAGHAHHHLLHARIGGAQQPVEPAQRFDLVLVADRIDRIDAGVQRRAFAGTSVRAACAVPSRAIARAEPAASISAWRVDVVGIGETGLLAGDRAHADALLDRMRAVLDDAVLHRPAFAADVLEIQVAEIDARTEQCAEGAPSSRRWHRARRAAAGGDSARLSDWVIGRSTCVGGD